MTPRQVTGKMYDEMSNYERFLFNNWSKIPWRYKMPPIVQTIVDAIKAVADFFVYMWKLLTGSL